MIKPVKIVPSHKTEGWCSLTTVYNTVSQVLPMSGRQVTVKIYILTFIQLTIIAFLAIINQKNIFLLPCRDHEDDCNDEESDDNVVVYRKQLLYIFEVMIL